MAQWLIIVSWVAVIFGLLTALALAFDVNAHPQHMKIMNVVWPITGLYLPVLGGLLYADMARRKPISVSMEMDAARGGRPFWKSVFVSTTHCAAGCVIGARRSCSGLDGRSSLSARSCLRGSGKASPRPSPPASTRAAPTARAKAADIVKLAGEGVKREDIAKRLNVGVASVYRALAEKRASMLAS